MMAKKLYHGGKAGLNVGDLLVPSPPHQEDGCPICVARAAGRVCTVREYRAYARQFGARAEPVLRLLEGAPDDAPVDPPSAEKAVYITSSAEYATWYASRSRGDLYRVQPIGPLKRSSEDLFESFTVSAARVVEVLRRGVRLSRKERRELEREWRKAEERAVKGRAAA